MSNKKTKNKSLYYTPEDLEITAASNKRERVWVVECPRCPAGKHEPCLDAHHYPRESNHRERITYG